MGREGLIGSHLLVVGCVLGDDATAGHVDQVGQASKDQAQEDKRFLSVEAEDDHFHKAHHGACRETQMQMSEPESRIHCRLDKILLSA